MRAGQLDRRITLMKPTTVEDPLYGPQLGPEAVFAERIPAQRLDDRPGKSESVEGGLRLAGHPATIRIRYMRGVTSDMRVILHEDTGDLSYSMTSTPAEIGRKEWLEFTVKAFSS